MPRSAIRVYPSAVDSWLMIVLYAGPASLVPLAAFMWLEGREDVAATCLLASIGLVLFNFLVTWPCRYTLTEDSLNIRCGLFFRSVPLERIEGAKLSSSWESAPAMSLRRVRIRLDKGHRIVSPLDREAFIRDLMAAVQQRRTHVAESLSSR